MCLYYIGVRGDQHWERAVLTFGQSRSDLHSGFAVSGPGQGSSPFDLILQQTYLRQVTASKTVPSAFNINVIFL